MIAVYELDMKTICTVHWGNYGDTGFILFISKTKKRAIELIKQEGGYKYNKEDDLWYNDAKEQWYKLEQLEYLP